MKDKVPRTLPSLDEKTAKRARLIYSLKDFQLALSSYDFLLECDFDAPISTVNLRRFKCYETTMIISYMRPFSRSYGAVNPLTPEELGIVSDAKHWDLHQRLCYLRNKVFAHSDEVKMRLLAKPLKVSMPDGFKFQSFITAFDEGLEFSNTIELMDVGSLIRTAYESVFMTLHEDFSQDENWEEFRLDYLK